MPKKEDRSDWVAVPSDLQSQQDATHNIAKAKSAYQFFQKDVSAELRSSTNNNNNSEEAFDLGEYSRQVRQRWTDLDDATRQKYKQMAAEDAARFAKESHLADVQAMERRERLQQERNALLIDATAENNYQRTTRREWDKKQRKDKKRQDKKKEKQKNKSKGKGDDDYCPSNDEKDDDDDGEESSSYDSSSSDSQDDKKKKPASRPQSQKQIEYRAKVQREKKDKETYIANRQDDLRQEKASQAKRRLEFLLQQSNIFSHFGSVKQDTAKYGIVQQQLQQQSASSEQQTANQDNSNDNDPSKQPSTRRGSLTAATSGDNLEELEEADEHEATYLTAQPSTLGFGQMRPYQLEGLNWMIRLQENGVNGILADEMGLGKTLQTISILVYMLEYQNVNGPHLILVPKSTLSNWMSELARWAPTLKAIRFHGDKAAREDMIKNVLEPAQRDSERDWHVCVTTYEVCNIEKNTLGKFAWSYLLIDEAHRLKNEASAFSKTVRLFETRYRVLITGTPLQNSLHELWALLNFLVPDVFEDAAQFDDWFNLEISDDDEKNKLISQLHKILRPFMLRRLKIDVEKSLPPKRETILYTGMSKMQKDLYRNILLRDIDAIKGTGSNRTAILNIVMQLRKCAGHPYLFPGVEDRTLPPLGEHLVENCGKMVLLDKLLKRLRERGHRVLLFTQMTRILDILEDYLVMRRFPYCRIDGGTSYDNREEFINAYNAPDSEKFIFLLSTRAGGLGINLQTADVVIIYDSDWNPQMDLQAQDRAHRIGQTKPVQVFRLVTEHTIEEKIVERAQQKLKLDAMVVQSGRLKDKDNKLSRDELLVAVRFGADTIFKSKDSSISNDDIDMILDAGKRKTQELNDKLKVAEKGDLLDFRLTDGSSAQTFEGIDYSGSALANARAEAEMLGIFDIGKRERKEANYNENSLFQKQITALGGGPQKPKKKKSIRLPKSFRLPRMEEWQMYDRETLLKIQEEEEAAFKALPEEQQKLATMKETALEPQQQDAIMEQATPEPQLHESTGASAAENAQSTDSQAAPFELPPLVSEEKQALKAKLLAEGFSDWNRYNFSAFVKASARVGRNDFEKIALEVGKSESDVRDFAAAFWGDLGKSRISEHEYDKAVKLIEKGEKKLGELKGLERGIRILVSLFDNPWEELEFTHVNCKDKLFTAEEDRHLLCWTRKYGFGNWHAIRIAARRNPNFRFDYFLRSLPVDVVARRCEQLLKAAEKEVEQLERKEREHAGLPTEPEKEGEELPPIELPKFRVIQARQRKEKQEKAALEKKKLLQNVEELEAQMDEIKERLKALNEGSSIARVSPDVQEPPARENFVRVSVTEQTAKQEHQKDEQEAERQDGFLGPDGEFVAFPDYDGSEEPAEWKKPFTHYCIRTRKSVKASLDPADRKNKKVVNGILKDNWIGLSEDDKQEWRDWSEWDKKRYARDLAIFEKRKSGANMGDSDSKSLETAHVPKKRKSESATGEMSIPKRRKT